ncbi:MAG: polysaccharide biosynthesis/export family protein [Thermoguttaceae bacterium]|nr:polysaccharide biosynthesis/export family protein [Thermoguttaceae bacterium]
MRKTIKAFLACLLVCGAAGGCVSIPSSQTVSPRYFKSKIHGAPRAEMEQINFVKLRMDKPAEELLGPNDVLGIYIAGITGRPDDPPPIHNIGQVQTTYDRPASGYPYAVRSDGTLSLPMLPEPLYVEGMTLVQAEEKIRQAYTIKRDIVRADANISVSLIKARTYHVTVIREDVQANDMIRSSFNSGSERGVAYMGSMNRGTATALELPAYRNDVLEALSQTGGLPGLNAKNEVVILRKAYSDEFSRTDYMNDAGYAQSKVADQYNANGGISGLSSDFGIVRIPLRVGPNDTPPQLTSEDVTLYDGDVVYIQSREAEVYYTGGLIKGGVYPIPRDYDLDVLGAIATAGGTVGASAGAATNNSAARVGSLIPPSRVLVLREVRGRQYVIEMKQKDMLRDPSQRILIEPNDVILVEYTTVELWFNMLYNCVNFSISPSDFRNK